MPLLEGTDGVRKMSKSYGNYIGIDEAPSQIFGKVMAISDEPPMWRYYELLSAKSLEDIAGLKTSVQNGSLHPKAAKETWPTKWYAVITAKKTPTKPARVSTPYLPGGGVPDDMPEHRRLRRRQHPWCFLKPLAL